MISLTFAAVCSKSGFLGLVPWYQYLDYGAETLAKGTPQETTICSVKNFTVLGSGSDIPLILLAVVDDLLRIAGLVAVGFVIFGAIKYATSQGNPDETAKAQSTVMNALIGLVIAMIGVAAVSFIGRSLS